MRSLQILYRIVLILSRFFTAFGGILDVRLPERTVKGRPQEIRRENMADLWLAGVITGLLLIYLLYALLKPEEF
jgi:K+-transporting ATPase KdpF subunit